jgi:hypothetical protein
VSLTFDPPGGDKHSARFGAGSYVSSASQQNQGINSSDTKKQYSSSVKSSVGTNNPDKTNTSNLVTI